MAECPSGRYLDEIVTSGGLTLEHPTEDHSGALGGMLDWSGSEYKFADWDELVKTIMGRLERSWVFYATWPTTPASAEYNAMVTELNDLRARYAAVRKPWTTDASAVGTTSYYWGIVLPNVAFDATDEIGALTGIAVDAQCLRQRIDEALAAAGGNPVTPGNTAHKPAPRSMSIIGTIGLIAASGAIAAGVLYAVRKIGST